MNEHLHEILDVAECPVQPDFTPVDPRVFDGVVQDDSDYHVDPLDRADFDYEINAFASATALDKAERLEEERLRSLEEFNS